MNKQIITPDAGRNILTRGLPKTGQTIEYRTGDDGNYEAGWWLKRLNANNRQRYIAKTILGDDIVFDRATGLMWAADGNAAGCNNGNITQWNESLAYASNLVFAGFNDWRLPNVKELASIVRYSGGVPLIDALFVNTYNDNYWSATTFSLYTDFSYVVDFGSGEVASQSRGLSEYIRCVRGGV